MSWTPVVRHWLLSHCLVCVGFVDFSSLFFSHNCGFCQDTGSVPEGELPAAIIFNSSSNYLYQLFPSSPSQSLQANFSPLKKLLAKYFLEILFVHTVSILWVNPSGVQSWHFLHQYFDYCCQYESVFFLNVSFPLRIWIISTKVQSLSYWNIQEKKFFSDFIIFFSIFAFLDFFCNDRIYAQSKIVIWLLTTDYSYYWLCLPYFVI